MSWFDATGIASLAKTALKEAQKTIDKALDIKEEYDGGDNLKSSSSTSSSSISVKLVEQSSPDSEQSDNGTKMIKQSLSNPILSTMATATSASNLWGSFTGSFFDTSNVNDSQTAPAVTIAPTSTSEMKMLASKKDDAISYTNSVVSSGGGGGGGANTSGRTSSASASESVELLSSPMTPSSSLTSPSANCQQNSSASCITLQHSQTPSDSIEIIKPSNDITPSDIATPDSVISTAAALTSASCTSISDSVEIIDENQITFNPTSISSSTEEISMRLYDDEDESVSYNTVSENTAPVTILDTNVVHQKQQLVPITTPPSRSGLSLHLSPSHQPLHSKCAKDQHHASVFENTKLKPSANVILEKSLESIEGQTTLSDSTQSFEDVQQILFDEAATNRHTNIAKKDDADTISPQSPDGNCDLVRSSLELAPCAATLVATATAGEHNSGHTSADEIETATSSDIEIISGPNGDSSSTNSFAGIAACKSSPSKFAASGSHSHYVVYGSSNKKKGHYRELSEASTYSLQSESGSDGCMHTASEFEKLARRISELTEVIEIREFKLVELGRENAELQEKNIELKHQLEALQLRTDSQEINSITDDYTQRMSALERKFQQTLRERDNLRTELKTIQTSLSKSISKDELEKLVKEKDMMVEELKAEGEKLSKQILQQSNIIKKLRSKEKESDSQLKRQSEQIDELTTELERSKKSLSAKDEVERTQMEAVHKLTSEKQKLAKELAHMKSELDDKTQKLKTLQTSFEAAKKELNEKQQEHLSLSRKARDLSSMQSEQQMLQQQNQQLTLELETMREKLKASASEQSGQHQRLRQENALLVRRLEEIEQRSEDQSHTVTEATIPLVRQCESLQSTLNARALAWEKQESAFLKKIELLEKQLANLSVNEQNANDQSDQLNARIQNLEETLSKALLRSEQSVTALQQKEMESELMRNDFKQKELTSDAEIQKCQVTIDELNATVEQLQLQLKEALEKERQRTPERRKLNRKISSVEFADNSVECGAGSDASDEKELSRIENNASPTLSLERLSANESVGSNLWQLDDIDSISNIGAGRSRPSISGSMYGPSSFAFSGGSALIETLQSSLKQRDGENHQLQWELSRLQSERNFLMTEVSTLTSQLDSIKDKVATYDSIVGQFTELQEQYDAILQMYGEKVEETQELRLDLQDVKDMYRAQIDDLLVQQRRLQKQLSNAQQSTGEESK